MPAGGAAVVPPPSLGSEKAAVTWTIRPIAAEHLQVHTADPQAFAQRLRNYGSLFIGKLASVVYSDKCVGTNHTLPTMASGRYTGGLWVGSYVKVATHQWLDERGVRVHGWPDRSLSSERQLILHLCLSR